MPAPTEEQKQQEWAKKVEELRKIEAERLTREYRANIQKGRIIDREQAAVDRAEDAKDVDGKLLWDKVREDAERLISEGPAGYNDWAIGTAKLISHCLLLAKATWYAPIFPFRDEIVGALDMACDKLWDKSLGALGDEIYERHLDPNEFAKFNIITGIDEKGRIDVKITRDGKEINKDPDPDTQKLVEHITTGVMAWAMTQGYDMKPNAPANEKGILYSNSGAGPDKITGEKFKELNSDPEKGLEKFLSGRFDMPTLTSSIRP